VLPNQTFGFDEPRDRVDDARPAAFAAAESTSINIGFPRRAPTRKANPTSVVRCT
jgi:hypothetical protein